MKSKEEVKSLCAEKNLKAAKFEDDIAGYFMDRYRQGDPSAVALVDNADPKNGKLSVWDYIVKNPGATCDEIPAKNAHTHLSYMLSYGLIHVSGMRHTDSGRSKREYTAGVKPDAVDGDPEQISANIGYTYVDDDDY